MTALTEMILISMMNTGEDSPLGDKRPLPFQRYPEWSEEMDPFNPQLIPWIIAALGLLSETGKLLGWW